MEDWEKKLYKKFVQSRVTNPRELKGDTIWESEQWLTGSPRELVVFIQDILEQELDRAREEWTEELRQAFYDTFYKSGELWFDYIFEDGDTKAEQNAKEVVEEYWKEIISKLTTK